MTELELKETIVFLWILCMCLQTQASPSQAEMKPEL